MSGGEVKERPIIFSGEMVRAIFDGRKTQTRRIVKPQPKIGMFMDDGNCINKVGGCPYPVEKRIVYSPYGKPEDLLWVRHNFYEGYKGTYNQQIWNQYTKEVIWPNGSLVNKVSIKDNQGLIDKDIWKYKPAIFMPRWASRITLEITDVRVERLQDISEEDAKAEGVAPLFDDETQKRRPECRSDDFLNYLWHGNHGINGMGNKKSDAWEYQYSGYKKARDSFSSLWEMIYGPGAWALNPWVWVITFKKLSEEN